MLGTLFDECLMGCGNPNVESEAARGAAIYPK